MAIKIDFLSSALQKLKSVLSETVNLDRRIMEEGKRFSVSLSGTDLTFSGSSLTVTGVEAGMIFPGHCFIPYSATLSCGRADLAVSLYTGWADPAGYAQSVIVAGERVDTGNLSRLDEGNTFNFIVRRFSTATNDPFWVRGSVSGILIAKNFSKITDYIIFHEGDSISENSAWSTYASDDVLFQGLVRNHLTPAQKTTRSVNKAKGGSDSTNWVAMMRSGSLDISEKVHMRIAMFGTNDVIKAYAANANSLNQTQIDALIATFIANVTLRVANYIKKYGNRSPFIIIGPPPVSNTVQEGALVQLRNALKSYLTGIGAGIWNGGSAPISKPSNNIYFCSFGQTNAQAGVYVATDTSKYVETSGDRVHPNLSGNTDMGNYLINMLTVNNIQL